MKGGHCSRILKAYFDSHFDFHICLQIPILMIFRIPIASSQAAAGSCHGSRWWKLRSHLWSSITNIVTTVMLSSILIGWPIFLASQLVSIPTMRIHFSSNILHHFAALLHIPIVNVPGFLASTVFSKHSARRLKMGFVP